MENAPGFRNPLERDWVRYSTFVVFIRRVPFDQNFRKFRFKIEWNRKFPENRLENFGPPLGRGLSFFLEIWKFRIRKFPVPFGISTQYPAPVPLAVKSYKMAASLSSRHCTRCKIMCHSSSLSRFLIAYSPR